MRTSFKPHFELLEDRLVLDGVGINTDVVEVPHEPEPAVEYYVEGTNWIDPNLPKGHNRHVDHVSWDTDPTTDGLVTVNVLIHDHGNLDAGALARINDAISEINSATENLLLIAVTDLNQSHNIHIHEDTSSGCGTNALGCAEYTIYINHDGKFGDGHGNHLFAGEDVGGISEATLLSGVNWYKGADASQIGANQYDYQTVVTQELLHLVGLSHDSIVYDNDPEVAQNTDHRSVMHGTLSTGIVRRFISTHDQDVLQHLYGPDQGGSDDSGKDKGPPPGRGKNKIQFVPQSLIEHTDSENKSINLTESNIDAVFSQFHMTEIFFNPLLFLDEDF